MTIGFIIDSFPAFSESFIHNQIIGMLNKGHEVYIFPKVIKEKEAWSVFENYDLNGRIILQKAPKASYYVRLKTLFTYFKNYKFNRKLILKSVNIFRKGKQALSLQTFWEIKPFLGKKIDVFYCHYGPNGNLATELKKIGFNIPFVTMFHGYDVRLGINEGANIYQEQFFNVEKVLSISEYNRSNLLSFGLNPSKLIDHKIGIDVKRFKKNGFKKSQNKLIILSVGRLVKAKGYEISIKAIHELLKIQNYSIEYRIIGHGIDEDYFQNMVREFDIQEQVKFLGAIPNHKIHKYFFEADIFLHPSFAEAMPVVLMEALMSGLPVIATNVGSVKELVINNKTGFLVPAHDSIQVTEKLKMLISNKELRENMGKQGRQLILQNHNNEVLNDKLERILNDIIHRNKVLINENAI